MAAGRLPLARTGVSITRSARGLDTALPAAIATLLRAAARAAHACEEFAAVIKMMRAPASAA